MDISYSPIHIFNVTELRELIANKEGTFRPRQTAFVFFKKGTFALKVNGEIIDYKNQKLFFISNRNTYEITLLSQDVELYICINNREFSHLANYRFNQFELFRLIALENRNAIDLPESERLFFWGILDNLHHVYNDSVNVSFKMDMLRHLQITLVYAIVNLLQAKKGDVDYKYNSRKEMISSNFIELLFKHFKDEKELGFYADKLHISIKYLSICVKATTKASPTFIIAQLIMYESRVLLSDKENTISMVADQLNFSDQYTFSKFFKKQMNISPSEFRRRVFQTVTI